jgi:hypothetical protein
MSNWTGVPILAAAAAISLGGSQQPSATAAVIEDTILGAPPGEGDPFIDEGGEG